MLAVHDNAGQQQYAYDRYGNRTIDQANTTGAGIPKPNFGVDQNTNRLTAPGGSTMTYDQAGNLTNDTYTGQGTRTYDAENRMISAQGGINSALQYYSYDGDGRRVKRSVNGAETWQVYGIGGELIAEYAANAAASSPQKEYGYRNGQLLITADAGSGGGNGGGPQSVSFTNVVGVSVSGNSITKTAGDDWSNAGAVSTQTIASGDGYMEFSGNQTGYARMVGLGNGDDGQSYTDVDFAIALFPSGDAHVYENGAYRAAIGGYTSSDVFRVAVESGVVKYKKNGTVVYTSTVAPSYPLWLTRRFTQMAARSAMWSSVALAAAVHRRRFTGW